MPPKRGDPRPAATATPTELEFCELCRRHHDQGRRHRYVRKHRELLDAALSRFRSKLSDLRRALLRGSPTSPPPGPRLWCPFCSADLVGLSRSSCSSAIYHLTSNEHLKGVKDFLRKHGGGMDQVDSLRISEDEVAKWEKEWEKGCESLSTGANKETEGLIGPSLGPMKAMGHITLLVQRVMALPVLEVLFILLHMELLDFPSHLGGHPKDMSTRAW